MNDDEKERYKEMAKSYEEFDHPFRLDPFKKIHWGVLEKWNDKTNVFKYVIEGGNFAYSYCVSRTGSNRSIKDFSGNVVGTALKGEYECLGFCHAPNATAYESLVKELQPYTSKGMWFQRINQENRQNHKVMSRINANWISSKVTGVGADIYGIYYAGNRKIPVVSNAQQLCFAKLDYQFDPLKIADILLQLQDTDFEVTGRGNAYGGPKKTWRRIIVRNVGDDRQNAKQQVHANTVFKRAPALLKILKDVAPFDMLDSMMLTRVSPAEGIIARHTDIALDKDKVVKGLNDGMSMRFHVVLQSNPDCLFHIWDLHGNKHSVSMKAGEIWYSDIRKPHAVDNKGDVFRLHLVLDWFSDAKLWNRFNLVVPDNCIISDKDFICPKKGFLI